MHIFLRQHYKLSSNLHFLLLLGKAIDILFFPLISQKQLYKYAFSNSLFWKFWEIYMQKFALHFAFNRL